MQDLKDKLIVALDVSSFEEAKKIVDKLYPTVQIFKVGSQLFTACGQQVVEMIGKKGAKVFLDLKFYDIPNTVFLSIGTGTALSYGIPRNIKDDVQCVTKFPVFMMTVHIQGGKKMLEAAMEGAKLRAKKLNIVRPFVIGVTKLTSEGDDKNTETTVLERAKLAKEAGLDGVVCSVHEAQKVRDEFGKDFLIVTPGIRPKGYKPDDQARIDTPQAAIEAGANFIVVGRPIIEAEDPLSAAEKILNLSDK